MELYEVPSFHLEIYISLNGYKWVPCWQLLYLFLEYRALLAASGALARSVMCSWLPRPPIPSDLLSLDGWSSTQGEYLSSWELSCESYVTIVVPNGLWHCFIVPFMNAISNVHPVWMLLVWLTWSFGIPNQMKNMFCSSWQSSWWVLRLFGKLTLVVSAIFCVVFISTTYSADYFLDLVDSARR